MWTEQQDGSTQRVSVPVQLLRPHGGEEVGEDFTDVSVHPLQGHVYTLTRCLVQKTLQASNIWRGRKKDLEIRMNLLAEPGYLQIKGRESKYKLLLLST